jgi:hypothetical protein
MKEIGEAIICVKHINESARPLLERLWRGIFRRRMRMVIGHGATTHEHYGDPRFQQQKQRKRCWCSLEIH